MTQAQLAEACGWESSGQARIGNYEKDRREPSLDDLRAIAAALQASLSELLSDDLVTHGSNISIPFAADEFVIIKQYTASGSAGNGHMNEHVEISGGLAFKRSWLQRRGLNAANLHVIYVQGASMEPTIADGNVVLMDESQIEPKNNKIFVIRQPDGELLIKRLIRSLTGTWIIRSDNDDKRQYPDFELSSSEMPELTILGRIVWHGGDL
jgi:phage repressor protein C with HTH and peptisase S24 domain